MKRLLRPIARRVLALPPWAAVAVVCAFALILRLGLLVTVVEHPGIADPMHYYNMALRIVGGHGLTIDYIWQYTLPPADIVHPEEHWMPGAAVLAALGMSVLGETPRAAIVPFALLGALLPALTWAAARGLRTPVAAALFAACAAAVLPEFVLNSLRTDTTLPAAVLVCAALIAIGRALGSPGRVRDAGDAARAWAWCAAAGVCAGLGYLVRSDAVLIVPLCAAVFVIGVAARRTRSGPRIALVRLASLAAVPVCALVVASPYLARNIALFGTPTTPEGRSMFFFTHHDDHYAYAREFSLDTMLAAQTPAAIIGKRAFELAAGIRGMITWADLFAPLLIAGAALVVGRAFGLGPPALRADARVRLWRLLPAVLLGVGALIAYAVFIPYKAQAGSFKKAWLMTLPALLPLAGLAFTGLIADRRMRVLAAALVCVLVGLSAVERVRADAAAARAYIDEIRIVAERAARLPDMNGDGEIRLMTQDPYILRYVGVRTVIYPFEPRAVIHGVAVRYRVDYLLMPPNRPALDRLWRGEETSALFTLSARIEGTPYSFWAVGP
jgi:hypothetical protein